MHYANQAGFRPPLEGGRCHGSRGLEAARREWVGRRGRRSSGRARSREHPGGYLQGSHTPGTEILRAAAAAPAFGLATRVLLGYFFLLSALPPLATLFAPRSRGLCQPFLPGTEFRWETEIKCRIGRNKGNRRNRSGALWARVSGGPSQRLCRSPRTRAAALFRGGPHPRRGRRDTGGWVSFWILPYRPRSAN